MVDFSKEAEQHSNGQQTMGQAAGAAAAAEAGAQQAAAAAQQAAQRAAGQQLPAPTPPPAEQAANPPSIWDNLPESEKYVKFTPANNFRQRLQFIDTEPHQKLSSFQNAAGNKMNYEFEVVDRLTPEPTIKTWSVSSVKLMNQLSAYLPLEDKTFDVQRVGDGLQIEYILTPVVAQ